MLFQRGSFTLHSKVKSDWKIECDALERSDYKTLAELVHQQYRFSTVVGVPTGGLQFADALLPYAEELEQPRVLIVDDVLTTGQSMEKVRQIVELWGPAEIIGVVVFARGPVPDWVKALFTFWRPS